jgi:bleomycin hydrolase
MNPRRVHQVLRLIVVVAMLGLLGQALAAPPTPRSRAAAAAKAAETRQLRRQVQEQGLRTAAVNQDFVRRHRSNYAVELPESPIRDQRQSGRCWAYAWTKTLQSMAQIKGNDPGKLSAAFINYYALRQLAHGAIDVARRTATTPEHSIYMPAGDMVSEGGYSHWANEIVKRHGIVPDGKMNSKFDSRESHILQNQLQRLVAEASVDLWKNRDASGHKRRTIASQYKKKVDRLLDTMIGAPPRRFKVDGKSYTPRTYLRDHLKLAAKDLEFVNLSHDPTRAWNRRYRENYGSGGIPENETYNVSMSTIQKAVKRTLNDGVAVNVAVNVDWDNPHRVSRRDAPSNDANGILSLKAFNYDKLTPTGKLSKRERMEHWISQSNHMMAITGYQPKKRGEQARWKIDNSHGSKSFRGGRFDMYDDFFKQYVEEVTVPRGVLPKNLLNKLEGKPALDAISKMSQPPSKGGNRWTPTRRRALVEALIRQDLSISEAAQRYNLPAKKVEQWHDDARKAMMDSLR